MRSRSAFGTADSPRAALPFIGPLHWLRATIVPAVRDPSGANRDWRRGWLIGWGPTRMDVVSRPGFPQTALDLTGLAQSADRSLFLVCRHRVVPVGGWKARPP